MKKCIRVIFSALVPLLIFCKEPGKKIETPLEELLKKSVPLSDDTTYSPAGAKLTIDILFKTLFTPNNLPSLVVQSFKTPDQKNFYNYYVNQHFTSLKNQRIDSLVSRDYRELNKFFKDRGYDIQFQPFSKNEVGAATDITIALEKLTPGTNTDITYKDKQYQAAKFSLTKRDAKNVTSVEMYTSNNQTEPIFVIRTKDAHYVEVVMAQTAATSSKNALTSYRACEKTLSQAMYVQNPSYKNLIVPKFITNDKANLGFLIGVLARDNKGNEYKVAQAIQQIKIVFTEQGTLAKVGTGISILATAMLQPQPEYVMDKPFHYMILYYEKGIPSPEQLLSKGIPVLFANVGEQEWKNFSKIS